MSAHPQFFETADVIAVVDDTDILTVVRKNEPFRGKHALPGGHRERRDPTSAHTAQRELYEETGVWLPLGEFTLFHVLDRFDRDPRGQYVSLVYTARMTRAEYERMKRAGSDAELLELIPLAHVSARKDCFAFDHFEAIQEYIAVFENDQNTTDE